uniref:Uncharacterized protein n=1 Tax=Opuntia streptacantha TaxID=393608 RepID=A0A7C8YD74_OPUST
MKIPGSFYNPQWTRNRNPRGVEWCPRRPLQGHLAPLSIGPPDNIWSINSWLRGSQKTRNYLRIICAPQVLENCALLPLFQPFSLIPLFCLIILLACLVTDEGFSPADLKIITCVCNKLEGESGRKRD